MKRSTILFALAVLALVPVATCLQSCKTQYDAVLESNDVDVKYNAAFDYFNRGKYSRAATLFESLTLLTNGTPRYDTVLYYLGLSNYSFKDYYTAEGNFQQYLTYFPQGNFSETADFLRIDCMYRSTLRYELDQTQTYSAITAKRKERFLVFQDDYLNFIGEYPESNYRKELDGLYEKVKEKY